MRLVEMVFKQRAKRIGFVFLGPIAAYACLLFFVGKVHDERVKSTHQVIADYYQTEKSGESPEVSLRQGVAHSAKRLAAQKGKVEDFRIELVVCQALGTPCVADIQVRRNQVWSRETVGVDWISAKGGKAEPYISSVDPG